MGASVLSLLLAAGPAFSQNSSVDRKADHQKTETPIKHVIEIIGENRTFDHLFATYVPRSKDLLSNLLSKQIIKVDGSPGKNFAKAGAGEIQRGD
jgi:phospholipase C